MLADGVHELPPHAVTQPSCSMGARCLLAKEGSLVAAFFVLRRCAGVMMRWSNWRWCATSRVGCHAE